MCIHIILKTITRIFFGGGHHKKLIIFLYYYFIIIILLLLLYSFIYHHTIFFSSSLVLMMIILILILLFSSASAHQIGKPPFNHAPTPSFSHYICTTENLEDMSKSKLLEAVNEAAKSKDFASLSPMFTAAPLLSDVQKQHFLKALQSLRVHIENKGRSTVEAVLSIALMLLIYC